MKWSALFRNISIAFGVVGLTGAFLAHFESTPIEWCKYFTLSSVFVVFPLFSLMVARGMFEELEQEDEEKKKNIKVSLKVIINSVLAIPNIIPAVFFIITALLMVGGMLVWYPFESVSWSSREEFTKQHAIGLGGIASIFHSFIVFHYSWWANEVTNIAREP